MIVVIAILAAISVVAYNGIQNRTHNSVVESDFATIAKKLELYRIANNGLYPASNAEIENANIAITTGSYYTVSDRANFYYCTDTSSPAQYAVGAIAKSKQGYYLVNGSVTKSNTDSTGTVWGSNTCTQIGLTQGNAGILSTAAYNNTNNTWADWVK